jgi:hypothetical protein
MTLRVQDHDGDANCRIISVARRRCWWLYSTRFRGADRVVCTSIVVNHISFLLSNNSEVSSTDYILVDQ